LIKDEAKITLKTAIKAKKGFNKNVEMILLGKNETKTNVFLCCGQSAYAGYVGWNNLV
jgi:hypothetical protein